MFYKKINFYRRAHSTALPNFNYFSWRTIFSSDENITKGSVETIYTLANCKRTNRGRRVQWDQGHNDHRPSVMLPALAVKIACSYMNLSLPEVGFMNRQTLARP